MIADRSRRNSGQYRTIAAHALLESYSVSLHINPLTCVSKSAVFLCNLTKNLTSQSAHPNLCGVALTTESAGGERKQSAGLFWQGTLAGGSPVTGTNPTNFREDRFVLNTGFLILEISQKGVLFKMNVI